MWPWSAAGRDLRRLLDRGAEAAADADADSGADGDYQVALGSGGFEMTPELLRAATPLVKRLVVYFCKPMGSPGTSCPLWIFELTELTGLCMNHYPFQTLPDEIGALRRLERLHMYGSSLTRLPRTVGNLHSLSELDLYTSYDLHYLPIEVLACARLKSSRFSTRSLFNNSKTRLALPELRDWRLAPECAAGLDYVAALLLRAWQGLPEGLVRRILSFLPRNRCSVCARWYLHDLGCNAWSHRVVATDAQALLAFCCGRGCASKISLEARYDAGANCNERFVEGAWHSEGSCPDPRALWAPLKTFNRTFEDEHLTPWGSPPRPSEPATGARAARRRSSAAAAARGGAASAFTAAPSSGQEVDRTVDRESGRLVGPQRYRALHSGDVRLGPGSGAAAVGRVGRGDVLEVVRSYTAADGRGWVLFLREASAGAPALEGWTALNKRDGLLKLEAA